MTHPSQPLALRCGYPNCHIMTPLVRCSRCKVQHYCSSEHQAADLASHKSPCNGVSRSLKTMTAKERKLNHLPSDTGLNSSPSTNSVGYFWGILETRPYMRARYAHVEQLARIKTQSSVTAQLEHVMDCLRLCRGDNMGVRDMVPHLMLRLNKDQEAYDFIKWYIVTGSRIDYDWGDMDLGFLDVKDADCFEDVEHLCSGYVEICSIIAATLLKVKLLIDLVSLQKCVDGREVPTNIPAEILNNVREYVVRSPVIRTRKDIMESQKQETRINELTAQVRKLFKVVDRANRHFWFSLLNPGTNLDARPDHYGCGDLSEIQHILKFTYDAWMETPGATEIVRSMMEAKQKTEKHIQFMTGRQSASGQE